ncbi:hypothetical protein GGQ61_004100 [Phenylobacterium haematophilum]|jgi:hypothetical protein|uniref:Lipoprotein n=1 Tax=Phenylobacterium haematophilum TaxID=98513 RepID=A0A840A4R5_9CAUL|nr:hypothetical protein [Phenylobacterium haematophilum]MBB3893358.1 hypothetical protein [Phenylobacterium haematophilum]
MIAGMKSGALVLKSWILLAAVGAATAGCSPREFKDRAGEIQLWAQRGFAESQADYGDSFPTSGGGGVYPRPQTDPAAEKAAAEKAAADAAPPAPKQQYVVIIP